MRFFFTLHLGLLSFSFAYSPSSFDSLLASYVSQTGFVDYDSWATSEVDVAALENFASEMAGFDPSQLDREEALAFWINAYNAFALHEVLARYPVESIRPAFLGIPERSFFVTQKHIVNGESHSLDQIENDILRKLDEPRIHFAINCASASCPVLRDEVYRARTLDTQLNEQAALFINDASRNQFNAVGKSAKISKIFNWFESDFDSAGGVRNYLLQFAEGEALETLQNEQVMIDFLQYDWRLNNAN